jgi:hypothetical protein
MNVDIGTEAAQFPEKEYINEIFLALQEMSFLDTSAPGIMYETHSYSKVYPNVP